MDKKIVAVVALGVLFACVPVARAQLPPLPGLTPDAAAEKIVGTAVIRGRVFAADTSKPLRRAQVSVTIPGVRQPRTSSTDLAGRYEIRDLPAGRYAISATRSGYLRVVHGQRRPTDAPRPVDVADGQRIENLDFALPRMSVVSGRVLDRHGEPIDHAVVMAYRYQFINGRRTLDAKRPWPPAAAFCRFSSSRPSSAELDLPSCLADQ